jgi:hypothetical protein
MSLEEIFLHLTTEEPSTTSGGPGSMEEVAHA